MLDPERQGKFSNIYEVVFPDYPSFNTQPRKIILTQHINSHDVVVLRFQYFSTLVVNSFKTGTPVQMSWRNDKVNKTFIGYVSHVQYPTTQVLNRYVEVVCIGGSYPLKEETSKIWVNTTASQVVTEIAKKFYLKPLVTPSTVKFSQISMAGHTYWEKLVELANKIGYGVQVLGTELHFHPIDTMIDQFMTTIPVMSFLDPFTNATSIFNVQTLDFFESKLGDYVEKHSNNRTSKVVSGVDPVTGKVYKTQSSPHTVGSPIRSNIKAPLFSKIESGVVANSDAMTKALADAKAQLSRLSIPGKGSGQGDPRISPWGTLEVRNTGGNSDGFWIVTSAKHEMTIDGKYTVDFSCATDGVGTNKPSATRPSSAGTVPTVNLNYPTAGTNPSNSYTLSTATALIDQTNTGFNIVPRRWVGV
jgi:phage protein D